MDHLPFQQAYQLLSARRGNLCVGVDPSRDALAAWNLPDDATGLRTFCSAFVEAAAEHVAVFKPQSAFFERHGPDGMLELQRLIAAAQERGTLVLLDAKRGDISSTAEAYGDAYLGRQSPFGADAMTVQAFVGLKALTPIFNLAVDRGAGIFVVVRSSNPEGSIVQLARTDNGKSVTDVFAQEITEFNEKTSTGLGPIGAVIGATLGLETSVVAAKLPNSLLLVPGIGAQGGTIEKVQQDFGEHFTRVLASISRAIADAGPHHASLRERVMQYARTAIGK